MGIAGHSNENLGSAVGSLFHSLEDIEKSVFTSGAHDAYGLSTVRKTISVSFTSLLVKCMERRLEAFLPKESPLRQIAFTPVILSISPPSIHGAS